MADVTVKPISSILVANRGEIARRIMRTARDMGIRTIAVYADGDADAPFVHEADSAYALSGRTSAETYLDIAKILEICRTSGADAVHPGYGFLSENADFASAVQEAGIAWIGPKPEVISSMGDKLSAKELMQDAGVPTLPAIEIDDGLDINSAAATIGYPVLVKASAGGGGRGMRVVANESELTDAIESAKREAGSAFGDDTVFLEKWLDRSRHIEIQIIGDRHGNLVHCFERECSIQRRHQKIIEEAPSPAVSEELRAKIGGAAVTAAKSLGYSSAGTVEFLLQDDNFYFLEVNARLQVEHPVTEEIIGHDLVREQIRVAEGETLSFSQDDLGISGHAIEARLCAEDPNNDFLPSPGPVDVWEPSPIGNARYDSGVESGSVIAVEFDAMIAKVISHAPTRREAAAKLARALETTSIQGLTTNRDFLISTLRSEAYLAGDTTTDFIERVEPARTREISPEEYAESVIAAAMASQALNRRDAKVLKSMRSGWRNSMLPFEILEFSTESTTCRVEYRSQRDGRFRVKIADQEFLVDVVESNDDSIRLDIDGKRISGKVRRSGDEWHIHSHRGDLSLTELPRYPLPEGGEQAGGLVAPMPGTVLSAEVSVGDMVTKGDLLVVLEAMKMEHRITAPKDGSIADVHVIAGDQVETDQLLVTMTEEE